MVRNNKETIMKIQNLTVSSSFNDIIAIGDIHGNYPAFLDAVQYADKNNLFILSLGDIVDYGLYSYEVFDLISTLVHQNKMAMVMGNHDSKIMRYFMGNAVVMEDKNQVTIDSFPANDPKAKDDFVSFMQDVPHIITYHDNVFVHAGIHRRFWQTDLNSKMKKAIVGMALYGQVDRDNPIDSNGLPNRIYKWVDDIPAGNTVFIGHDVFSEPTYNQNENGGAVWKVDTGSSKGGYLSGVIVGTDQVVKF